MGLAGVGVRHADTDRTAVVEAGHLVRVDVRVRVDPHLDLTIALTLAST